MEEIRNNELQEEMVVKEEPKKRGRKKGSTNTPKTKKVEEKVEEKPQRLTKRLKSANSGIDTSNLDKDRKVPVISVKNGCVGYQCKLTPNRIKWREYGAEHMMTIGELLVMFAQDKIFLETPWLIVDDVEFAETLKLMDMYESIFDTEELESFFADSLPNIKKKLEKLPKEIRRDVLERATIMINEGKLNNLNVVRLLKDNYKIDVSI